MFVRLLYLLFSVFCAYVSADAASTDSFVTLVEPRTLSTAPYFSLLVTLVNSPTASDNSMRAYATRIARVDITNLTGEVGNGFQSDVVDAPVNCIGGRKLWVHDHCRLTLSLDNNTAFFVGYNVSDGMAISENTSRSVVLVDGNLGTSLRNSGTGKYWRAVAASSAASSPLIYAASDGIYSQPSSSNSASRISGIDNEGSTRNYTSVFFLSNSTYAAIQYRDHDRGLVWNGENRKGTKLLLAGARVSDVIIWTYSTSVGFGAFLTASQTSTLFANTNTSVPRTVSGLKDFVVLPNHHIVYFTTNGEVYYVEVLYSSLSNVMIAMPGRLIWQSGNVTVNGTTVPVDIGGMVLMPITPLPIPTLTSTATASATATMTASSTRSLSPGVTPSRSSSPTSTISATQTPTPTTTTTSTVSPTATLSLGASPSHTPTRTPTPSHTPSGSVTPTGTSSKPPDIGAIVRAATAGNGSIGVIAGVVGGVVLVAVVGFLVFKAIDYRRNQQRLQRLKGGVNAYGPGSYMNGFASAGLAEQPTIVYQVNMGAPRGKTRV